MRLLPSRLLVLALALLPLCGTSALSQPSAPAAAVAPSPPRDDVADWLARLELAKLLTESGRHAEAAEEFRKVLRDRPGETQARIGLARALFWSGKRDEAAAELAKAPPAALSAEDRLLQAEIHLAAGRHEQAIDALIAYLALRPADLKARLKLADALSWRKRLDESLAEYEKILSATPDDRQVRRRYARVLTWAGRNDDAIRELRISLGR
ncbi:Tetratricopeptide repeat-containing protein [Humidesulfovibrio mexicanus]|uniref:Tetratricopeptide repeat-containing protein n=1 Tax=Humidesulfovibrio mexicanus TaxID=147047 RepID=A0A239D3P2_9BACT|nr:tetratricopeptide repeat protein [Humidesulfovibrio mexicanus]SNS26658.1 Tetratricopeptide repeat-containing protein [Humidesulfovibrio mexicanus]